MENMAHGTLIYLILRNWDALILMQAMQLAQAVRDDVVGAQRDALLADLRLQMDSVSSCTAPEDSGSLTFSDIL